MAWFESERGHTASDDNDWEPAVCLTECPMAIPDVKLEPPLEASRQKPLREK